MLHTDTSKLNIMIEGDNNNETIILLHGGPGVPDYLAAVSCVLSKSYRTIRFDQRGTGKSECLNDDYSIEEYIYDLDQIIEYCKIDKVHLFGHSWGGLLAQLYTSKNKKKIKSLFLCSPSSGVGEVWKKMEKEVMIYNKLKSSHKEWFVIGLNSLLGIIGSDNGYRNIFRYVWKFYFKNPTKAPEADEAWLLGIKARAIKKTRKSIISFENKLLDERLDGIDIPVTVIFGEYDIYGESKYLVKKRLPNSEYIILDDSGHLPWLQCKEKFLSILFEHYGLP